LRRAKGLPGFRSERLHGLLKRAIRDTRRDGFRITHYSVQQDHIHLIAEAEDKAKLSNGMRSFVVRVAMRVNSRILGRRRGRVWGTGIIVAISPRRAMFATRWSMSSPTT
jgi:putative transposase